MRSIRKKRNILVILSIFAKSCGVAKNIWRKLSITALEDANFIHTAASRQAGSEMCNTKNIIIIIKHHKKWPSSSSVSESAA